MMGALFVCKGIFWRIFAICNAKMLLKSYSQTIPEFLSKGARKRIKVCYNMSINWFPNWFLFDGKRAKMLKKGLKMHHMVQKTPWPSGKAKVCNTSIPGPIPGGASKKRDQSS